MNFSGRAVSPDGNYLCKYDSEGHTLEITMINGEKILFHEVHFPYRGEELAQYLKERKDSVGYMMERKKDGNGREYLIFNITKQFLQKNRFITFPAIMDISKTYEEQK